MFAHVTTFQINSGALDEVIRRFQDAIAPAAARLPGFAGVLLLIERTTGRVMSIGLWETEDELLSGERSGPYQQQLSKVKDLLASTLVRELYEVAVQAEMTQQGRVPSSSAPTLASGPTAAQPGSRATRNR